MTHRATVLSGIILLLGTSAFALDLPPKVEIWVEKASHKRRERDRERESRELRHITKSRVWWKEPPEDGPEGDH